MNIDPKEYYKYLVYLILILILGFLVSISYIARSEPIYPQPLIDEAMAHLGKPYRWSASGESAFDCSGFTCYCYEKVYGIELERSAKAQGYDDTYTLIPSLYALKPGDLVYFNTNTHDHDLSDHAGIYIGNGEFIHSSSGKGGVVISSLWEGFYNRQFSWGRRVFFDTEDDIDAAKNTLQ